MNTIHHLYILVTKVYRSWVYPFLPGSGKRLAVTWEKLNKSGSGLTPEEVNAVKETWALVAQDPKGNSVKLFLNFFTDFPHYKKKFKGFAHVKFHDLPDNPRLKAHAFTVISSIGSLVDSINDPEVLSELLISIGHNHKPRKLTMKDFQNLCESIMRFFAIALKDNWTPQAKSGWEKVFDVLMTHIQTGLMKKN